MFCHVMVGSNDIEKSKRFYDAVFNVIGVEESGVDAKGRLYYKKDNQRFMVTIPLDGKPAVRANGGTIGFLLKSPQEVDDWHWAGIENGGESIEAPPGVREVNGVKKYLAYLRDPDGNKICAVF